jgi:GH25 family lysozyme M1 (1,4-beta-N-acetylmuramidase)
MMAQHEPMRTSGSSSFGAALGLVLSLASFLAADPAAAIDVAPWTSSEHALVVDAYELNIIDWSAMLKDKRIAGFVSKASDGLPESFSCTGAHKGDTVAHCKTMWRKYAVSRELYQTRRMVARASGLLWGAYHLARPGNPIEQANHFLDYAEPADDELMVLDIEGMDPENFMSLEDAGIFASHIKTRTGRYPMLYTNHSTARHIADNRALYPILSRLPLWYARYKPGIRQVFPMGNWDSYALWQFSTGSNCNKRRCPYRVAGTLPDIDVNVAPMKAETLKATWAKGELLPEKPLPVSPLPTEPAVPPLLGPPVVTLVATREGRPACTGADADRRASADIDPMPTASISAGERRIALR